MQQHPERPAVAGRAAVQRPPLGHRPDQRGPHLVPPPPARTAQLLGQRLLGHPGEQPAQQGRTVLADQHRGGRHVAVHQARPVQRPQRPGEVRRHLRRPVRRQRAGPEQRVQRQSGGPFLDRPQQVALDERPGALQQSGVPGRRGADRRHPPHQPLPRLRDRAFRLLIPDQHRRQLQRAHPHDVTGPLVRGERAQRLQVVRQPITPRQHLPRARSHACSSPLAAKPSCPRKAPPGSPGLPSVHGLERSHRHGLRRGRQQQQ